MATQADHSAPWRKRCHENSLKMDTPKKPRYYYRLQSESSAASSEDDTESVHSIQDKETDVARDTSDTERQSVASRYEVEIEYEVDSLTDEDDNSLIDSSGDSDVDHDFVLAAAAAICDNSFEKWVTDGEDSDNSSTEESSFNRTDYWTCIQCKSQNNNPLFRYCEKCFQDRKTFFPPRPRHYRNSKKSKKAPNSPVKLDTLRSCLSGLSQDSGIGSSQECPPLGLDQIVVPRYLTEGSSKTDLDHEERISSQQLSGDDSQSQSNLKDKKSTFNDLLQNLANRKRQMSESSLSEYEVKRPRRRENKNSSNTGMSKNKDNNKMTSTIVGNGKLADDFVINEKTSDLGSEISSSSGCFNKAECEDATKRSLPETSEMCIFCNINPKNSIFLHGSIAHMCCCYKCAKRTWKTIKRCPICNRKVNNVVKVYKT